MVVDAQLVRNSLVFSRKKFDRTKMTEIVTDVFWNVVISLCEINCAAVSVPTVDEIVDDNYCILLAFTNQIIKDDNLLLVHRKLFKGDYFIPKCLDDLVPNLVVDSGGKLLFECLIFVLIEIFRKQVNLVIPKQLLKHVHQNVCFAGIVGATNQHPKNISWHAKVALFVIVRGGKNWIIIWNFHIIYTTPAKHVHVKVETKS